MWPQVKDVMTTDPVCLSMDALSLGDLAVDRDPESALADISQGEPNL